MRLDYFNTGECKAKYYLVSIVRFGIVLPCSIYAHHRQRNALRSLASLARTVVGDLPTPTLFFVVKPVRNTEAIVAHRSFPQFAKQVVYQPADAADVDAAVAYGFECLADRGFDRILHVCDDFIYHPGWLLELRDLIGRHPDAIACSVYRSGYSGNHWTIETRGQDNLVNSISSTGAITPAEWKAWGMRYQDVSERGATLDVLHGRQRRGERWVTEKSYIQQLVGYGVHSAPYDPDQALEFVGERVLVAG